MARTKWPLMVLIFVGTGICLTWFSPDLVSSAAPPPDQQQAGAEAPATTWPAPAAEPKDGWRKLSYAGQDYDAGRVAVVTLQPTAPVAADETAAETKTATQPAPATQPSAHCRKYLRTAHAPAPKAAPKGGLLDRPGKAVPVDETKTVAVLNQRIRNADECLKRAAPGG